MDSGDLLIDHYIGYCGDDSHIVMTHTKGIDNKEIHQLAWNAFMAGTNVAKEEGLYGAGQDLLKDSFSGNIFTILTERAIINHRIVGVVINVKHRCEIHMNTNTFAMTCNLFSQLIDQCIRLHRTHCHLLWKFKRGIQSHIKAPFRINTN